MVDTFPWSVISSSPIYDITGLFFSFQCAICVLVHNRIIPGDSYLSYIQRWSLLTPNHTAPSFVQSTEILNMKQTVDKTFTGTNVNVTVNKNFPFATGTKLNVNNFTAQWFTAYKDSWGAFSHGKRPQNLTATKRNAKLGTRLPSNLIRRPTRYHLLN